MDALSFQLDYVIDEYKRLENIVGAIDATLLVNFGKENKQGNPALYEMAKSTQNNLVNILTYYVTKLKGE